MPFAAALLARVPTQLLGSNPQHVNSGRLLIRIFSLKTCAAHIAHEGNLAALLIEAHDVASLLDHLAASRIAIARMGVIAEKQQIDGVRARNVRFPPDIDQIADIDQHGRDVRFVPQADSCTAANRMLFSDDGRR